LAEPGPATSGAKATSWCGDEAMVEIDERGAPAPAERRRLGPYSVAQIGHGTMRLTGRHMFGPPADRRRSFDDGAGRSRRLGGASATGREPDAQTRVLLDCGAARRRPEM
jgi:hypothetical protein